MRVLHLVPSLGVGGAERQLTLLATELQRRGVQVEIAYGQSGAFEPQLLRAGVTLHRLESSGNHDPALAWRCWWLARSTRPDIIQTWLLQMDVLGALVARSLRTPLIVTERSSERSYPPGWKSSLRLWAGRQADAIVANSEGGLDYWRAHGCGARLRLVRNAVAPQFSRHRHAPRADGRSVVLFAGRLSPEKNVLRLVQAMILAAAHRADVEFRLVGNGPLRDELKRQISAAGMNARIFLDGATEHLAELMASAALCVSVSEYEGHPNVVSEAATVGCPLLVSDIRAHREILDETMAWFVRPDDALAIAAALLQALADGPRTRRQAEAALVASRQWSLDHMVDAYTDVYVGALRGRPRTVAGIPL